MNSPSVTLSAQLCSPTTSAHGPDVASRCLGQPAASVPGAAPDARPPVLVVDDHELVSASLTIALQSYGLPAVCCVVTDTEGVVHCAAAMQPGLALLDLELGRDSWNGPVDGVELASALRADGWTVVAVTGQLTPERMAAAIAGGAAAVLSKSTPLRELLRVVADVAAGRSVISHEERRRWLSLHRQLQADARRHANRLSKLTPRERDVLDRLVRGHRAAAIADEFVVSLTTVRSQIRSILLKLGVRSQLEAVALAGRSDRGTAGTQSSQRVPQQR